jgi:hypothetical protein
VKTAVILAWELAVETADVATAVTVGDVLVVGKLAAAASRGTDTVDAAVAVVSATLTETFEVAARYVGEPSAEDPSCAEDVETFELALAAGGVDVVKGSDAAVVVALVNEVLGLCVAVVGVVLVGVVLVVSVPVTEVLAPPEACTTPACGSVDDPV